MIRAEVHSDDYKATAKFDATKWFEQATLEELQGLAGIGWRGDYEADDVAEFMEDKDEEVAFVFKFVSKTDNGFECSVSEHDAVAWVRANKPDWFDKVWPDGYDEEVDTYEDPDDE